LKNPFLVFYIILYTVFLILLGTVEGFDLTEPILILLIIGVGFSSLAWWITKGLKPLTLPVKQPASECGLLLFYLMFIVVPFLTWGMTLLRNAIVTEPMNSLGVMFAKLTVTVLVPLLLFGRLWGYRLRDFISFSFDWKKHLRMTFLMSLALIAFQLAFGAGLDRIRQSGLNEWQLGIGLPFVFLWLVIEVGLVEEFFFRALIQSRIATLFRSEITGVVLMALLFGLAHAPGMYFRGAEQEFIGPSPSLLMAIGYSIVVVSILGIFMGILWARTKNLLALVFIHAAGDLIPNMAEIIRNWISW